LEYYYFKKEFYMYTYQFDIHNKGLITDCPLHPTDVSQRNSPWLYARNNKYVDESINPIKIGKWMLFVSDDTVNRVWDEIKIAVANGDLWRSKVSTHNPKKSSYAIMIYTKDYTDLNDVIHILNYLETSGIKPSHVTIKYRTDEQTRAGIYSGSRQKPWIYSSDTIRGLTATRGSDSFYWKDIPVANQASSSASAPPKPNYPR
jgi:hypothetical protein